jgi:signal transduction histidine kinase
MTGEGRETRDEGTPPAPPRLASLRAELLVSLAALATAAIALVAVTISAFGAMLDDRGTAWGLATMIAGDIVVFLLLGAYLIRRHVLLPIDDMVAAADEIAQGDLSRRLARGRTRELDRLAAAINAMTDRLIEERAQVVRVEKMAGIGRLAAGVAHEIGNPLGAINGYTYLLRQRLAGDAQSRDVVAAVEREAGRIDRIVRGLLDYARPRRGARGAVRLDEAVATVSRLLADQGALRGVRLTTRVAPGIPPLEGDQHEMEQVLVNLVLNAVDAMPGGGTIVVAARRGTLEELTTERVHREGDPFYVTVLRAPNARLATWLAAAGSPREMIQLVVADSGPGIPDEDRERVFDPFFTTQDPGKGTGLGLAIVARLVEEMRGTIWVRRAREGGAAFVLVFPLAVGAPRGRGTPARAPAVAAGAA